MGKIFIGGSRKWDMYPDETVVDICDRILYNIIQDAFIYDDEIVVGDCPEGVDQWVVNTVMVCNRSAIEPVKLTIVCNNESRIKVPNENWCSVINLRHHYDRGFGKPSLYDDPTLSEVLQNNDILNPDWSDQSIKDKYMMELCDIHRFIWNGKSKATYRNALISGYTTESDNTIIYRPYVVADRIVWTAKFTYGDDFHDDCMSDI